MSDKLVFNEDVAREALRAIRLTNARLASAQANADTYAEAAGHRELSKAIRGSASSWRINRNRLSERLTSVGNAVDGVATTLKAIDDAFAAGMRAGSQPSSDAVGSSPHASGGGGSAGGGSQQHIPDPDALASPGASAGVHGGGVPSAQAGGLAPEAPVGGSPEGSPPAGSGVSTPENSAPGSMPWGPGALLPTMPTGSEQQQLRTVLAEFAAKWESVTGTPPEGVIALLGLLGAAGAGAAAASGSPRSANPPAGGDSTAEGSGGGASSAASPGTSGATTGQVDASDPGTPAQSGGEHVSGVLDEAGSDGAIADADEAPRDVPRPDVDPAVPETGVEDNVTAPPTEVPERVADLAESAGPSPIDGAALPVADLPELAAASTSSVLPDLLPLAAAAQPTASSAAPGLASVADLPPLGANAQPAGSSTMAVGSLPPLEAHPGPASEPLAGPQLPLGPLGEAGQPGAAGAVPVGPMSSSAPRPAPVGGGGLGVSGSSATPGLASSSSGPRDAHVLVVDEPSSIEFDTDDGHEEGSAPGE